MDCLFNPSVNERIFDYKFLVVKSKGQGSAYSLNKFYDVNELKTYMGKNIKDLNIKDLALKIAVMIQYMVLYKKKIIWICILKVIHQRKQLKELE